MTIEIKHFSKERLKEEILKILNKYLDLDKYKVFFFGSRVTGKANERSDIDIGIEGPEKIPLRLMSQIRNEIIDLPTLYTVDIVDFKAVDRNFLNVAKKEIELIT